MNILMVLSTGVFPPDRRVEREARDLLREGHAVYLMARRGPGQTAREVIDGVQVLRVPLPFQRRRMLADLVYYLFQRYSILWRIVRACRRHRIDALHVHDLPYALATVIAGKLLGLPVVFDMHEHYTEMVRMGFEAGAYRKLKLFSFPLLALLRFEEKIACRGASRVVVVADEHIPRIVGLGAGRDDVLVVTNTEDCDHFSGLPLDEDIIRCYHGDFPILYVGVLNAHRGIDTAIQAMPDVLDRIPNARLLLVGDGPSRLELQRLAERLNLRDRVVFVGYQPFAKLPTYIHLSEVCLIPHISTPHIETTMPNKLFQYMILGRPVVVSNVAPLVRVVSDADCGLIFEECDPGSLAENLGRLGDAVLRRRLGENGRRAVADRYNWHESVAPLLELYRVLAARKPAKEAPA